MSKATLAACAFVRELQIGAVADKIGAARANAGCGNYLWENTTGQVLCP